MFKKIALIISLVVMMLVVAVPVAAVDPIPGDCLDYVETANGFGICFLGNSDPDEFGMVTWTYAVKVLDAPAALSHITFTVCIDDAENVTPGDGETWETLLSFGSVFGTPDVTYEVEITGEPDPTTGVNGIKYEDPEPQQLEGDGEVHIFQFTQPLQTNPGTADTDVGTKAGSANGVTATILGPVCDGTSAVDFTAFNASGGLFARLLSWLGLR